MENMLSLPVTLSGKQLTNIFTLRSSHDRRPNCDPFLRSCALTMAKRHLQEARPSWGNFKHRRDVCQRVNRSLARGGQRPGPSSGSPGKEAHCLPTSQHPPGTQAPVPGVGEGCTHSASMSLTSCEHGSATERSRHPEVK